MTWTQGLKQNGQYYDGIVSSADDRLEVFKRMTVTSWGTRRSSKPGEKDIAVSFGHEHMVIFIMGDRLLV